MAHEKLSKASNNNRGQTMVEFALVVALLLAILFGIVEFGRLWFYSNHLNNSVRAAARHGVVLGDVSPGFARTDITNYAYDEIDSYINATPGSTSPGGVVVTVNFFRNITGTVPSGELLKKGDTLEVTATYYFQVLSGGIIPFFSGIRPIMRTASMQYE